MIRPMELPDAAQVARVHLASFPGFFLSFMGEGFLRLFYAGVCRASHGIRFVYLDDQGRTAGFVAGSADPSGFYSELLRRDWARFGLASMSALFRRPAIIFRLLGALGRSTPDPADGGTAGLFSLGVDPGLQGRGAGKQLVAAFLDEARRRGSRRVSLTTDRVNNDAVNAFYRAMGFSVRRQFITRQGRMMNEYWIDLAPGAGDDG
jgi:ribosomal protein S18 acetylase RimI-like enzyme